jgi:hypothetical protein
MHNAERFAFTVIQRELGPASPVPQRPLGLTYQGRSFTVLGRLDVGAEGTLSRLRQLAVVGEISHMSD